jgi:DNA polymerase-1
MRLLLIDAYSLIYRAFYAIRALNSPSGDPVNAVYGFTKMLRKLQAEHSPTHVAVVFDLGAPRHRLAAFPQYKAQRPPTPPALESQLPVIRELLAALALPVVEVEGEEADDVIATLARRGVEARGTVLIASSDKDFMQLVDSRIQLIRPDGKQSAVIGAEGVKARYGVEPGQIVDFLSLLGDSVDNIPGVPGVGEKTASDLLTKFGTLDNLLARAGDIPKPSLRKAILSHANDLRRNRELVRLRADLDFPVTPHQLAPSIPDWIRLQSLYKQLGFKSLLADAEAQCGTTDDLFAPR